MVETLDVVYLFGYSSNTGTHLERLLPILKSQKKKNSNIGIVLIHDGVIGITTKGRIPKQMEDLLDVNVIIFAMIPDLKARGIALEYISEKVRLIEYDDLVDILDTTPKLISWM
ncbi:MAG: DsrH/TusB family sulfur metabolism protein [Candidatus Hermodarchaeota archaeon]